MSGKFKTIETVLQQLALDTRSKLQMNSTKTIQVASISCFALILERSAHRRTEIRNQLKSAGFQSFDPSVRELAVSEGTMLKFCEERVPGSYMFAFAPKTNCMHSMEPIHVHAVKIEIAIH